MAASSNKTLALGAAILLVGALGFLHLPGMLPSDATPIDAIYCATITLTTVGYGDICPDSPNELGKLFLVVLSFTGLGFFCGPVSQLALTSNR